MWHALGRTAVAPLQRLLHGFLQDDAFPFGSVLMVKDIVDLISQEWAATCDRICTPVGTLWPFLRHIHSDAPACRAAVARLNATRVAQGLAPCAPRTGGYGKARQRMPETLRHYLVLLRGQRLQQPAPTAWHWHGRAGKIVDGSGGSRPDTAAHQPASPPPGRQAPGLGLPGARLVGVVSLAWGAVLAAAVGRLQGQQTSAPMLFQGLQTSLERAEVVLADRVYCSYWEIALVLGRGSDLVRRWQQRRQVDLQCGRRVGREDHGGSWATPKRPAWMDATT